MFAKSLKVSRDLKVPAVNADVQGQNWGQNWVTSAYHSMQMHF